MKTGRFAIVLAGLLLLLFVAWRIVGARKAGFETHLSQEVARQVQQVEARFDANRRALKPVEGAGGVQGYPLDAVRGLIARTREDLDRALQQVGEPRLGALSAWSDEEIGRIQREIPPPRPTTSSPASPAPSPAAATDTAARGALPITIPVATANWLLDKVKKVIHKIFVLASTDDLWVDLWVGSAPTTQAQFNLVQQSSFKGSPPIIIHTDGSQEVVRGLYTYSVTPGKGAGSQPIKSSLNLIEDNGRLFCCYFNDPRNCQHVKHKEDCH